METFNEYIAFLGPMGALLFVGFIGVVMALGIVVDDAIIVVENIERHLEAGMRPIPAALQGVRE